MKGGVGKTTLAANLALGLARFHNKRVLLVDLDPQFNATQYLMWSEDYLAHIKDGKKCTIKDIFIARTSESVGFASETIIKDTKVKPTKDNCIVRIYNNASGGVLDLVPSTLDLMEADILGRGIENKLKNFLDKIKKGYDYVLLDCPPTISLFTISAFLASDSYLTPIKPDWLSSIGLSLIDRAMRRFSDNYGKEIEYLGLVFVMAKPTRLMKSIMKQLRAYPQLNCFESAFSDSTRIAETGPHLSVFDLTGKNAKYGIQMRSIVDEFVLRVEKTDE
jgi:chromosome partitioning protein